MRERRENDSFCVTQLQHWIVRYLEHNQKADTFQKDLEEEFHVSRATISNTLQVMERNGMICRTAVKQDARLKKITLTDKARQFSCQARKHVQELEQCMEKGMTKEERNELIRLLRRVRQNLEENEAGRHEASGGKMNERRENHLC